MYSFLGKKWRIFGICLAFLAANAPLALAKSATTVKCHVQGEHDREVRFSFFSDPLFFDENYFAFNVVTDSVFTFRTNLDEGVFADLQVGNEAFQLWFEPGKNLELFINILPEKVELEFKGDLMAENRFLYANRRAFPAPNQEIETFMANLDCNDFKKAVIDCGVKMSEFAETNIDFQKSSLSFKSGYTRAKKYWVAAQVLRYAFDKPLFTNSDTPLVLDSAYYAFLQLYDVSVDGLLGFPDYLIFLENYLRYAGLQPQNAGLDNSALAEKLLAGEPRAFVKAKELSLQLKRSNSDETKRKVKTLLENCKTPVVCQALENNLIQHDGIQTGVLAPDFSLVDANGIAHSRDSFAGKTLVLHFWATWCAVCREEMPVIDQFWAEADKENVALALISFDKFDQTWRSYMTDHALPGLQLWSGSFSHATIVKLFGLQGLPATVVLDPSGKIIAIEKGTVSLEKLHNFIKSKS